MTLKLAGLLASLIGMMNLFAGPLGGIAGDWAGNKWGMAGRTRLLGVTILVEGLLMVLFSRLTVLGPATIAFLLFGLSVCMACGVVFAVVPLVHPKAVGSVSGIVGAGGNLGAVLAAVLFKSESLAGANAFLILGILVAAASFCVFALRFRESPFRYCRSTRCPRSWRLTRGYAKRTVCVSRNQLFFLIRCEIRCEHADRIFQRPHSFGA